MIFVTVGTHEQQFDRLLISIDKLKANGTIKEKIVMQTGFSTYEPRYCQWSKLFPYKEMQKYIADARIVITHGGPASFIAPLQFGKIPIVVPRQKKFNEHVNNHQLEFCRIIEKRHKNIIVVENIQKMGEVIKKYNEQIVSMQRGIESNNIKFCREFEIMINQLMNK